MTYMGGNSKARVDTQHPDSFGICDRCGNLRNLSDLKYQFQWRGESLVNSNILVCPPCLDIPNEQLRTIVLPPDPLPVPDARPPQWASQMGPTPPNIPVYQLIDGDE